MATTLEQDIAAIRSAVYGREVRSAIADGIQKCYTDISSRVTIADSTLDQMTDALAACGTATQNANDAALLANDVATLDDVAAHVNIVIFGR